MLKYIFHGSDHVIEHPAYHGGKRWNDYGYGFYCTESADMAKEWGVTAEKDGFANAYQLDMDGLKVLNLNENGSLLSWLAVLLQHRRFNLDTPLAREAHRYLIKNFSVPVEDFDIILGYRADDSYFSFAQDFINNTISYEQLSVAMRLGALGEQFVLKSRRSFERLQFQEAFSALRTEWLEKKERRDRMARNAYLHSERMKYRKGDLYIIEILDKEMKPDDSRLR